jgi:hypothetical protein
MTSRSHCPSPESSVRCGVRGARVCARGRPRMRARARALAGRVRAPAQRAGGGPLGGCVRMRECCCSSRTRTVTHAPLRRPTREMQSRRHAVAARRARCNLGDTPSPPDARDAIAETRPRACVRARLRMRARVRVGARLRACANRCEALVDVPHLADARIQYIII